MPPPHTTPSAESTHAIQPSRGVCVSLAARSNTQPQVMRMQLATPRRFWVCVENARRANIAISTRVTMPRVRLTTTVAMPESVAA